MVEQRNGPTPESGTYAGSSVEAVAKVPYFGVISRNDHPAPCCHVLLIGGLIREIRLKPILPCPKYYPVLSSLTAPLWCLPLANGVQALTGTSALLSSSKSMKKIRACSTLADRSNPIKPAVYVGCLRTWRPLAPMSASSSSSAKDRLLAIRKNVGKGQGLLPEQPCRSSFLYRTSALVLHWRAESRRERSVWPKSVVSSLISLGRLQQPQCIRLLVES